MPLAFGSKAKRNGLRSPVAKISWHVVPPAPGRCGTSGAGAEERVVGGHAAGAGDAHDLAVEDVEVAGGVVVAGAAAVALVVAAAIADGDVQMAVLADLQITGVVVAGVGVHAVQQDDLAGRVDSVVVARARTWTPG